ncbi:MAG: hypothetical protein QOF38_4600, partial [Pseudonocardiales bacterium]|nr:hypothetical protein [Pseudonocardiales bacterium]
MKMAPTVQTRTEKSGTGSLGPRPKLESSDLLEEVVPESRRDGSLKMTLLWVTCQATVSNMYTG